VLHLSGISAAALAAVLLLAPGAPLQAEPASKSGSASKTTVSKTATSKKSASVKKKTGKSGSKSSKKARHVVRRSGGAVVVDRVAVEQPAFYGPFLPLEVVDYPRPECDPIDVVLEAHVHETDSETPETDSAVDDMPETEENPLTRAARSFGSLLRPKSSESKMRPEDVDLSDLLSAGVQIPVEGVDSSKLRDSFLNSRGRHRKHLAIDIGAPKGTPVVAAADGEIITLRREKRGGISLYQKDKSGKYLLYYCHLSRYKKGLKVGDRVEKGQVIAQVGRTGHASGPHLHFSITRLAEEDDNFKAGVAVNPYLLFLATAVQ
jgi:murein DD-endopeptidase MepM/ murein hydrolase activator NlpD